MPQTGEALIFVCDLSTFQLNELLPCGIFQNDPQHSEIATFWVKKLGSHVLPRTGVGMTSCRVFPGKRAFLIGER